MSSGGVRRSGFGTGGVSGAALLPVGVLATWLVRRAVDVPIMGVGRRRARRRTRVQYLLAGASLVGDGNGGAARSARAGARRARARGVVSRARRATVRELTGALEWTTDDSARAIVALDVPDCGAMRRRCSSGSGRKRRLLKVGSELFTAAGPEIVRQLRARGAMCSSISSCTTSRTRCATRRAKRRDAGRAARDGARVGRRAMLEAAVEGGRARRVACWR